jgi:cobalt-factor III methyltransferase
MDGNVVAVISSGDAGGYGMARAGTVATIQRLKLSPAFLPLTRVQLYWRPVMHDACIITLSDHLTPWAIIEKRIEAAPAADFVIALYNPKSGRRTRQIVETQRILIKYRNPKTPVGLGLDKSTYGDRQVEVPFSG